MKIKLFYFFAPLLLLAMLGCVSPVFSQGQNVSDATSSGVLLENAENLPQDEYYRAKVIEILRLEKDNDPYSLTQDQSIQHVRVLFLNGSLKDTIMDLPYFAKSSDPAQLLKKSEQVVILKNYGIDRTSYVIVDRYRISRVGMIALVFIMLVLLLSRGVGVRSMVGLAFSIVVIIFYIIPQILTGHNPIAVSIIGSVVIALISLYLAHGFNYRTTIALVCTLITIIISVAFAVLAVHWARLLGTGSEESLYLQMSDTSQINLQGLLLGGIIVGILGVLDDITTAQSAVVDELKKANPDFHFRELFSRGLSVGKEHIASLINTLALAYVGASFPLLLLFTQYKQPLYVLLNNELISEEIIRTLVGSITLILAVPITTAIAAYFFSKKTPSVQR